MQDSYVYVRRNAHSFEPARGSVALSPDGCRFQDWLGQLEEGPRRALKLVYYEGMPYDEVAAYAGVPVATVKSWVRGSLARLKGCSER